MIVSAQNRTNCASIPGGTDRSRSVSTDQRAAADRKRARWTDRDAEPGCGRGQRGPDRMIYAVCRTLVACSGAANSVDSAPDEPKESKVFESPGFESPQKSCKNLVELAQ
jgi:hypothetical protein